MCHELGTFVTILLPPMHGVRLTHVTVEKTSLRLQRTAIAPTAACPLCGLPSSAIHSRYQRRLTDLPWGTRTVHVQLTVRKFLCRTATCLRRIFTERLPAWLAQHPTLTVVCRDRSDLYADGIRQGAPQAVQVVDRFHLGHNLRQALEG